MKILLIGKQLNNTGGQEIVMENLIKSFAQRDNNVTVLTKSTGEELKKRYPEVSFETKINSKDSNIFDVIHFHNPFHFFTLCQILKLKNKNKICTFHSKSFSPNIFKKTILKIYTFSILSFLGFFIDKFIFLTNHDKNYFKKRLLIKKNSFIIGNCIDSSFFYKKRTLPQKPSVLFVGRLVESKGVFDLLQTAEKMPDLEFKIVGKGKINRKMPRNFNILGTKNRSEIAKIYKQSDIFILPSRSECMPLTILEALGMGLPIICSDIPELKELVKDNENGFIVENNKPELIVEAINKLIKINGLYEAISTNNISKAKKNYSLEKFKQSHLKLYEK